MLNRFAIQILSPNGSQKTTKTPKGKVVPAATHGSTLGDAMKALLSRGDVQRGEAQIGRISVQRPETKAGSGERLTQNRDTKEETCYTGAAGSYCVNKKLARTAAEGLRLARSIRASSVAAEKGNAEAVAKSETRAVGIMKRIASGTGQRVFTKTELKAMRKEGAPAASAPAASAAADYNRNYGKSRQRAGAY